MKLAHLIFIALLFVALPGAASAEPITAIVTAIQAFAAKSVVANFIVNTLVSTALTALASAIRGKPDRPRPPGLKTDATTSGGTNPQNTVFGRAATYGNWSAPPYSHPNSGDVPNRYLTYVIDVSDLPGVQFSRLIVNGAYVTDLRPHDGLHDLEGLIVDGAPHVFLTFHDGTGVQPDPYMMANYADFPDRPWLSDMIGRGIAYAVITFDYDRKVFSSFPKIKIEVDGVPLYDPRHDSTVGGFGGHRWGVFDTWAGTRNPIVMIYNILRGIELPDGRIWGGDALAEDLPLDNWFAAMNECDVQMSGLAQSVRAQYEAGLEIDFEEEPADVIDQLLKACSGEIVEIGGTFKVRVGPPALPVYFFTDDDVVVDEPGDLEPFKGLEATYNAIHATHPSPEAFWEATEAPSIYNAAWEAEDGGRQLPTSVDMPAVSNDAQVQQLMRAWINDARRMRIHGLTLPPAASLLEPLDVVAWTSAANGYEAKAFEIGSMSENLVLCLPAVSLREREAGDFHWDPGQHETVIEYPPAATFVLPARVVPDWTLTPAELLDHTGTGRIPAIRLDWQATGLVDVTGLEYQVRPKDQAEMVSSGSHGQVDAGFLYITQGIAANGQYEARWRLVTARSVQWSEWRGVTAPDVRISELDLGDEVFALVARVAQERANAIKDRHFGPMQLALDNLAQETALGMLDAYRGDLENRESLVQFREEFVAQLGDAVAAITAEATARASGDQASIEYTDNKAAGIGDTIVGVQGTINVLASQANAQASQVATLFAQQADQGAQVTQATEAIAGLGATVQMSVNVNGHISGWAFTSELGENEVPTSSFVIDADVFQIGAGGEATKPFVYYPADTMVDGVLVEAGAYIDAGFFRKASIQNAMIGDAQVDTLKIADHAVIVPVFAKGPVVSAPGFGVWRLVTTVSVHLDEAAFIVATWSIGLNIAIGGGWTIRVKHNNTVLEEFSQGNNFRTVDFGQAGVSGIVGENSFTIELSTTAAGISAQASILAMGAKR
jgi:hypothetical protein